jgi:uncharacterized protein (DUF433 family)
MGSNDDAQIARYIEEAPDYPGPAGARLIDSGVPVWALIGYYQKAVNQDLDRVASDYGVSRAAVQAALAYYRRHKPFIDGRIAANAA